MAMLVKKRMEVPGRALAGRMNPLASMQPMGHDEGMDFGFEETGPDYDDREDDGPPYEASPDEDPCEPAIQKPVSAGIPMKKSLRKLAMPVTAATIVESPATVAASAPPKTKNMDTASERSRLSCELTRNHHRRLKIHSVMSGKSILAIIEGWVDEHCPPL